jgi:predicted transposase YdaD
MAMTLRKSLILGVIAEESSKTKKARAKLKDKLDATDKKLKNQTLEKKSQEIARWIERHAHDRVVVKKDISLFDQNRNSAKMSRNTEKLAEELAIDLKIGKKK